MTVGSASRAALSNSGSRRSPTTSPRSPTRASSPSNSTTSLPRSNRSPRCYSPPRTGRRSSEPSSPNGRANRRLRAAGPGTCRPQASARVAGFGGGGDELVGVGHVGREGVGLGVAVSDQREVHEQVVAGPVDVGEQALVLVALLDVADETYGSAGRQQGLRSVGRGDRKALHGRVGLHGLG